jgi:hypothetical protein
MQQWIVDKENMLTFSNDEVISKIEKELWSIEDVVFRKKQRSELPFVLFLIFFGLPVLFWIPMILSEDYSISYGFGLLISFSVLIFIILLSHFDLFQLSLTTKKLRLQKALVKKFSSTETIEEILTLAEEARNIIKQTMKLRKIFPEQGNNLLNLEVLFVSRLLNDLKSDLSLCLSEKQEEIHWARVANDITLTWTPYENILPHQKVRLDSQIEQFEELQKILVKI